MYSTCTMLKLFCYLLYNAASMADLTIMHMNIVTGLAHHKTISPSLWVRVVWY